MSSSRRDARSPEGFAPQSVPRASARGGSRFFAALIVAPCLSLGCRADPVAPLRATECAPGQGHPAGGQIVFIQGEGFDPKAAATVLFGSTPAPRVHVTTPTKVQVEVPPGAPGLEVDVQVQQKGRSTLVPGKFKYFSPGELHEHTGDGGH